MHLKLTNTLIVEVLETFRLRKVRGRRPEDESGSVYDMGDDYFKCVEDYEVGWRAK